MTIRTYLGSFETEEEAKKAYEQNYREQSSKIYQLEKEIKALRDMIDGNYPEACWWLATKVDRQRVALDNLQKKGKGHTKEEREQAAA